VVGNRWGSGPRLGVGGEVTKEAEKGKGDIWGLRVFKSVSAGLGSQTDGKRKRGGKGVPRKRRPWKLARAERSGVKKDSVLIKGDYYTKRPTMGGLKHQMLKPTMPILTGKKRQIY